MKVVQKWMLGAAVVLAGGLLLLRLNPPLPYGYRLLRFTTTHGLQGVARLQLALGVDPDEGHARELGPTPFTDAAISGAMPMARLLAAHGANKDHIYASGEPNGNVLAHVGGHPNSVARARDLLALGVGVNTLGCFGQTPLHEAASANDAGLVEFLIAHGAFVNARDSRGRTPLGWAIRDRSLRAIATLRRHGGTM